ncbi:S4 domain-containing protein, partial [Sedimentibacter sp.]
MDDLKTKEYNEIDIDDGNYDEDEISIVSDVENERIDVYIAGKFTEMSRSSVQKLIADGMITVNSKSIKANYKLKKNDEINITIPEPEPLDIIAENIPVDIVYEDDD